MSGLAYGLGLVFGNAFAYLITDNIITIVPEQDALSDINILLAGLLLAFISAGLAGGIGGFIGGWSLPAVDRSNGRWGYGWQSALCLALTYATFLFMAALLVSLLSFYAVAEVPPSDFAILFMAIGALSGAVSGLLLGLLTVGWRRTAFVTLAALIGFGLGGSGLGLGLRASLMSVKQGHLDGSQFLPLLLGIGSLGLLGGGTLGIIYNYLAGRPLEARPSTRARRRLLWTYGATIVFLLVVWLTIHPLLAQLRAVLTVREAGLASQLASDTIGTHWSESTLTAPAGEQTRQVEIASSGNQIVLAWAQQTAVSSTLVFQRGFWHDDSQAAEWVESHPVFHGGTAATAPRIALDGSGHLHLVWRVDSDVLYSRCQSEGCLEPVALSDETQAVCAGGQLEDAIIQEQSPALAIGPGDELLIVWHGAGGMLYYALGPASGPPSAGETGCILADGPDSPTQLQLAAGMDGQFSLVYANHQANDIRQLWYTDQVWQTEAQVVGQGDWPQVTADDQGQIHLAWCGEDARLRHWHAGTVTSLADPPCLNRPELVLDSDGRLHLIWYSDQVTKSTGSVTQQPLLYEAIQAADGWTEAAIVTHLSRPIQPTATNGDSGVLHLAWPDDRLGQPGVHLASQVQYHCDDRPLPRLAQIAHDVAYQNQYRPLDDLIPYCRNRYDRILVTPGPDPAFSPTPPTRNGGFDGLAELITAANYEVLISTMDYDEDEDGDSPGSIIAKAVADLYQHLAENPARYPRGVTVRILLGNPPRVGTPKFRSQLWNLITDLREAGVPEMVNSDLGWRLEVANYEGAWPHSHAKILVVDGKTVVAAGFNMQYTHFPQTHLSGLGDGTVDAALQISGPVAQDGRLAFDELWTGAAMRHCRDFFPPHRLWQLTCDDRPAVSDHVPEVMRYYLPGGESTAFSMLRTAAYDEADQQVITALSEAQSQIDIMHVQFSLPLVCNLNLLFDVCTTRHALPYMHSILDVAEQNETQVRLLVKLKPLKGIESMLAVDVLQAEVEARGLSDRVEIRPFPGPVHAKTTLIDDELLIIGSQNYHWSAYGHKQGLAEYSLGVSDPQAVADFQRMFEFYWAKAN